jgi:hypothetical protein
MKNIITKIAIVGAVLASALSAASAAPHNDSGYYDSHGYVTQDEQRTRDNESQGG